MTNTTENNYPRLVSWSYYPASPYIKNDKETLIEVYLHDPKGEPILEQGILPSLGIFMKKSPYFTIRRTEGKTKRAKSHGLLGRSMKNKYPDLKDKLRRTNRKILDFGEYVFIDLAYIDNYVNPIVNKEKWYNNQYIKKEEFTVDFIRELIDYEPRALHSRSVIRAYSERELPEFLRELAFFSKDLYEEAIKGTRLEEQEIDYTDLKAKLHSLKPGLVGYKLDILTEEFYWDGELLTKKEKTRDNSEVEVLVRPGKEVIVEILENKTVTEETVFVD